MKKDQNGLRSAQEHAKRKKGSCLSSQYINSRTLMEWKCFNPQHKPWKARYSNVVKNDTWCPQCPKNSKKENGLKSAQEHAENKRGECISSEYINVDAHLEWKCHNPLHKPWKATYYNVLSRNSWCPECGREEQIKKRQLIDGLKIAKEFAKKKGGKCLSTEYINAQTLMEWKCKNKNHKPWKATHPNIIKLDTWCRRCAIEERQKKVSINGLKVAKEFAKRKGGECLSPKYINIDTHLEWKCSNPNHKSWKANSYNVLVRGSWCPECGQSRNLQESRVRNLLNYIFDTEFIQVKNLSWNKNPKTNRFLELDGYSKELNIAFEYQGIQHYKLNFGISEEELLSIQNRDKIKKENCKNNDTKLIVIDCIKYTSKGLPYSEYFKNKVFEAIKNAGLKIEKEIDVETLEKIINLTPINDRQLHFLIKAQQYAINKKGILLSNQYVNAHEKLEWHCGKNNHKSWFASYNSVISNDSWCRKCAMEKRAKNKD